MTAIEIDALIESRKGYKESYRIIRDIAIAQIYTIRNANLEIKHLEAEIKRLNDDAAKPKVI